MILYKYKSLDNLWYILDIIVNQRLYCAHWSELNDPLEGRYSITFKNNDRSNQKEMCKTLDGFKDLIRISALSENLNNLLLWSHYASGHRGVALEIDIPKNDDCLYKVQYSPFNIIIEDKPNYVNVIYDLFKLKTEEWEYEKEYRILSPDTFFQLPNPIKKIYLGPLVSNNQKTILQGVLPSSIQLIETEIDYNQGWIIERK